VVDFPALAGQRFYRDDNLSGFAVRVTAKSKSFILEKRVGGINRRITIGRCDEMDLATAKTKAYIMLSEIAMPNKLNRHSLRAPPRSAPT